MKKISEILKNNSISFWYLNFMICALILIPKSNFGLENFPLRIGLMFIYILLVFMDYKKHKITFNHFNSRPLSIVFGLFIIFCIPSLFITKSLFTSIYTISKFIMAYITFVLVLKTKYNDKEISTLYKSALFSSTIIIVYGLISYIFDINLFTESNYLYPGSLGRVSSTFFNPIYFGMYINLIYPLLLYKLCITKGKKNIFYIILLILSYIALLVTFTRSALLVFLVVFVMMFILFRKTIFNFKTLVIIVCMIISTISIPGAQKLFLSSMSDGIKIINNVTSFIPGFELDDFIYKDYDENSEFTDFSLQHREAFARIAKEIGNDNIYTGVGFGAYLDYMNSEDFERNYPEYTLSKTHPHSSFVLLFAEVGIFPVILMFIFMILILLYFIINIISLWKKKNSVYYDSALGFLLTIGFFVVNLISENAFYDTQIFSLYLIFTGILLSKTIREKRVMFISSTGGHLEELMQLKEMFKNYDYYIVTEKTKSNLSLKAKHPKKISFLTYGTYTTLSKKFTYPFKLLLNCFKSLYIYIKFRPEYIVSTGAHTAGPMCLLGKILGSKIIFIETFANSKTKSKTGALVYKFADLFIVQWEAMLELYPDAVYGGWIF